MAVPRRIGDLSPQRQHLVRLMQRTGYGRIENLAIRNGQPVLSLEVRLVREIKFGGDSGVHPDTAAADFTLKQQVVELMLALDRIGNGTIECLTIKGGLPFGMHVDWPPMAA